MSVDADEYNSSKNFVSCASCTANGFAPMVKAIHDEFYSHKSFSLSISAQLLQRLKVYLFSSFNSGVFIATYLRTLKQINHNYYYIHCVNA